MASPLWSDSGTWIAVGVTVISIVAAVVMHRVFIKVLQQPPTKPTQSTELVPKPDDTSGLDTPKK